jgi:hypothetical protein
MTRHGAVALCRNAFDFPAARSCPSSPAARPAVLLLHESPSSARMLLETHAAVAVSLMRDFIQREATRQG